MQDPKIELGFLKLAKALISLKDIAFKPLQADRSNIDATIQRFEFTIELFWKLLRAILEKKGVQVQYPKDVLKEAFRGHLIDHEQEWLKMLLDRNLSSHTYDEQLANKIYANIRLYIPLLTTTFDKLQFLKNSF
jgi:nucleotidyltransferase substrate binding protein (TIGR01987 family)